MGATGTTPYKRLGAWTARAADTVYQAPTGGIAVAIAEVTAQVAYNLAAYTDAATPPTTQREKIASINTGGVFVCCPVKKYDYWEIKTASVSNVSVWWISLEP